MAQYKITGDTAPIRDLNYTAGMIALIPNKLTDLARLLDDVDGGAAGWLDNITGDWLMRLPGETSMAPMVNRLRAAANSMPELVERLSSEARVYEQAMGIYDDSERSGITAFAQWAALIFPQWATSISSRVIDAIPKVFESISRDAQTKEKAESVFNDPNWRTHNGNEEQCKGFAKDVFKAIHGINLPSTDNPEYKYKDSNEIRQIGQVTGNATAGEIQQMFANAKTGDVVQMYYRYKDAGNWKNTPHTAIVKAVTETGVVFFHGNTTDPNDSSNKKAYGVTTTYTWAQLDERLAYDDHGMTVYTPNK
jgi:hypothetical protein